MYHRAYLEAERAALQGATEGNLAAVDGELCSALRSHCETRSERILSYSARTLERITFAHRAAGEGTRKGRKSGSASNRIKTFVLIRCGPQEFDDLYEKAWLPLRNYFIPVMKLIEKQRVGGKVRKKYDKAASPCERLLVCPKVSAATKESLRQIRLGLDPMDLSEDIERRLVEIFAIVEHMEEEGSEEPENLEVHPRIAAARVDSVTASVAVAPRASTESTLSESLAKSWPNEHKSTTRWVS